jgi:hypothetical protein
MSDEIKVTPPELSLDEYVDLLPEDHRARRALKRLNDREDWLCCLEMAGVDNWSGFDYARDLRDGKERF